MRLYHGTSRLLVPSIMETGIKRSENEVWPEDQSVCAMDSLAKARGVAADFGKDGVVLEIDVPDDKLIFHPDYGEGVEFDTIHIMMDVPPSMIVDAIDASSDLEDEYVRRAGQGLVQWKSERFRDKKFTDRLDKMLSDMGLDY